MKMALLGNTLLIKDASDEQRTAIESWNRMEWNTETQIFSGPADLELLSRLARMVRLPPAVAGYRDRLWDEQNAAKYANTRLPEPPYAWLGKLALRGNVLQISDLDSETIPHHQKLAAAEVGPENTVLLRHRRPGTAGQAG